MSGRASGRIGLEEAAGLREVGGEQPPPLATPAQDLARQSGEPRRREAEEVRALGLVDQGEVEVILQVAADARQSVLDGNAMALQLLRRADARQQQELRRLEGAGREDDGAAGGDGLFGAAAAADDAGGAPARQRHPQGARAGGDLEVGPLAQVGRQIGARRAPALALLLRHLIEADALLGRTVEITVARQLQLVAGFEKGVVDRVGADEIGDIERAVAAVQRAAEALVALRALEVGEHVGERPAGGAERRPVVVVAGVAADVDHGIHAGRAAEHAPARLVAAAACEPGLRHGLERPVAPLAGKEYGARRRARGRARGRRRVRPRSGTRALPDRR